MRDYGKVQTTFWTSEDMRSLTDAGKMLALYLLTGIHTNQIGCFRLPDGYVCEDLGWDAKTVSKGFAELLENGFATRDEGSKWVFIHKYLKWNIIENPNQAKAAERLFEQVPNTTPVKALLSKGLREFSSRFSSQVLDDFETLSKPLPKPFRNQEQEQEQEQEHKQEQEQDKCAETATKKSEAKKVKLDAESLVSTYDGLSLDVAKDYIDYRKQKRAPLNQTSWKKIVSEIALSGITPDEALATAMSAGWQGLEASWLINRNTKQSATVIPMSSRPRLPNQMTEEERRAQHEKTTRDAKRMVFGDDDFIDGVASHV